jgi:hypothetical protein
MFFLLLNSAVFLLIFARLYACDAARDRGWHSRFDSLTLDIDVTTSRLCRRDRSFAQ